MAEVLVENLTKRFQETTAVKDFSISVKDGEFLTLLGPSGCGKTTILRCIAGFIPVTGGKIYIGNRLVSSSNPAVNIPPEKRNLGMVFQSYAVWPHMNVWENIVYPLKIKRVPEKAQKEMARKTIDILKLRGYEHRYPSELSGGQQQRVALGRAIIVKPDVLLLDEPLSNLDAKLREEMRFELKELQKKLGVTIIYVTHDQIEAISMSDRIAVISKAVLQQVGNPHEIYENPANRFVASFIGKANFIRGTVIKADKKAEIKLESEDVVSILNRWSVSEGEKITFMFRPHDVKILKGKDEPSIKAEVVSAVYTGDRKIILLDLKGIKITVETSPETSVKTGEKLYFSVKKGVILKE